MVEVTLEKPEAIDDRWLQAKLQRIRSARSAALAEVELRAVVREVHTAVRVAQWHAAAAATRRPKT